MKDGIFTAKAGFIGGVIATIIALKVAKLIHKVV